jgi:tRNA A37 threonylcarbamoyladenosine dehydratase
MNTVDRERRFGGIARLYGDAALGRLGQAHVCVVGIGGVGSWAAEALARSGIGRLTLIDLDHVAESNVNRQSHAIEATLGQAKVLAMADRIRSINPDCCVTAADAFVAPDNLARTVPDCEVLVDAIDQLSAKAALIAWCRGRGLPVVTTGGAGGKTDPTLIRIADLARTSHDPLAAKLRALLRRDFAFPRDVKADFGVECIYSLESVRQPSRAACDTDAGPQGLSCAGYGSSVSVTGAFGFAAASRVLARLAAGA